MSSPQAAAVGTAAALYAADAAYRAMIAQTSLTVVRALVAGWNDVDSNDIAGSSRVWLQTAIEAVLTGRTDASRIADVYTRTVRQFVLPQAPAWTPPPAEPPNVEQIQNSLIYTGLATTARDLARAEATRRAAQSAEPVDPSGFAPDPNSSDRDLAGARQRIMAEGIARAAGAATRHVTTGGRDKMVLNVTSDTLARGWVRTTAAGCCYYCAMLASRGPVYKQDSFSSSNGRFQGAGEQKVHDNCGCGLRPWYEAGEDVPERVDELSDLWATSTTGFSGDRAILAFRRAYEGRGTPTAGR